MIETWLPATLKGFEQLQRDVHGANGRRLRPEEIAENGLAANRAAAAAAVAGRRPRRLCRVVGRPRGHGVSAPARPSGRAGLGGAGTRPLAAARVWPMGRRNPRRSVLYRGRRARPDRLSGAFHPGGRDRLASRARLLGQGLCLGGGARRARLRLWQLGSCGNRRGHGARPICARAGSWSGSA